MVWNRRATKKGGRVNPETAWIWSPEPVHEPLVTRAMYGAANEIATLTRKSRQSSGPNLRHPDTKRSYRLRSYVFCELCGRRMAGKAIRRHTYFSCEPGKNLGPKAATTLPGHPPSIYVQEDVIEEAVSSFFAERVFGPRRRELLEEYLAAGQTQTDRDLALQIKGLRRSLVDIEKRQARQVRALEVVDDADGLGLRQVSLRLKELDEERRRLLAKIAALESATPQPVTEARLSLLDSLPVLDFELRAIPEELSRPLFRAFRLSAGYDRFANLLSCEVTVSGQDLETLAAAVTHLRGAPNGIRTRAATLKGW